MSDKPAQVAKGKRSDAQANADAAKVADDTSAAQDVTKKGPLSPAQHDDDGWGDTPVQMRGE